MTDYRKWDKFDCSDSEDETPMPMVSTFTRKGGESIQIGPDGYKVVDKSQVKNLKEDPKVIKVDESEEKGSNGYYGRTEHVDSIFGKIPGESSNKIGTTSSLNTIIANETKNGDQFESWHWCQDRYEASLTMRLQSNIKAKDIRVTLARDPAPSSRIITSEDERFKHFRIEHFPSSSSSSQQYGGKVLFEGTLRYEVIVDKDILSTNQLSKNMVVLDEWEILSRPSTYTNTSSERVLKITFQKKSPIPGALIWWSAVFVGDREIDVQKISGRGESHLKKLQENAEAWKNAHEQFKQKVNDREKVEV